MLKFPAVGHRLDIALGQISSDSVVIAQHLALQKPSAPLVILCAAAADMYRIAEEIVACQQQVSKENIFLLADWETLPYDHFSPPKELVSERLTTLSALVTGRCQVLLLSVNAALQPVPPPTYLAGFSFGLKIGQTLAIDALRLQLEFAGYIHVKQVVAPGEYAVRGGLVDLFPMGTVLPLRIDLFDEEIESIKVFDPDSQRTLYPIKEINLLPAHEFPLDEAGRKVFRQNFRSHFEGDPSRVQLYKSVSQGIAPPGIEYYLPLFFNEKATIFNYLTPGASVITHGAIDIAAAEFWQECRTRYQFRLGDIGAPPLPCDALFVSETEFFSQLKSCRRLQLTIGGSTNVRDDFAPVPNVAISHRHESPLKNLLQFIQQYTGNICLLTESAGRQETLLQLCLEHQLTPKPIGEFSQVFGLTTVNPDEKLMLAVAPLQHGFILHAAGKPPLAVITEAELYATSPSRTRKAKRQADPDHWLRDLSELKIGDPVVHEVHGIGRYEGLIHLEMWNGEVEMLELHYANDSKLLVPVAQMHLISRYSGADPEQAPLHPLGGGHWDKAKKKAAQIIYDTAAELLALYATRASRVGHVFDFSATDYAAFADGFGFAETPDQAAAIEAVLADMRSEKPMDRLVCGDVGFGKTEVALRAAFCAVAGGKQVAILAPTTLLCEQHYITFSDRFAQWPVKIAELSRFKSAKEIKQSLAEMASGQLDIVIGTHKLIQKDIHFKRLGLVIIDEEHRFGVRQKEQLKHLRAEVDVLALTATPIPRTLAMSLEGLREFSVIATAPEKRLPIKTFVANGSDSIIREALLRELMRGGQVYFLHNEVSTIESQRDRLLKIAPDARIVIGHGQMPERDLERVMRDFSAQRANVLLCTTIIETGIDNPHANTILINNAHKFGMAQLHQLRGRVGRSHHQAYAYLLVDEDRQLTKQARARLEAIQSMEELGSGFYLAMHDMEIRGAGDVLGDNQSGEIAAIGFNRYTEMLNRAIKQMKDGEPVDVDSLTQPLRQACDINLQFPALLPHSYCADVQERLNIYKTLAHTSDEAAINEMKESLIDRFGPMPAEAETLIATHKIRLLLEPLRIFRLDASDSAVHLYFGPEFHQKPGISAERIIALIQSDRRCKLLGQEKLSFHKSSTTVNERVAAIKELLAKLQ